MWSASSCLSALLSDDIILAASAPASLLGTVAFKSTMLLPKWPSAGSPEKLAAGTASAFSNAASTFSLSSVACRTTSTSAAENFSSSGIDKKKKERGSKKLLRGRLGRCHFDWLGLGHGP